jgi:hypothetical protein
MLLNPLWSYLARPGMFRPENLPPITAPVDGLFYLRNAEQGYSWATRDPYSLWFHPLLSAVVGTLPNWLPPNFWFWVLGLTFAIGCLPLITTLISVLSGPDAARSNWLPVCLLVPGGLGMATGNAEIPCLFFTSILLLSVIYWQHLWLTVLSAAAAILTKPNALYMVAVLALYIGWGIATKNGSLWKHALVGLVALVFAWIAWIWYVDVSTGYSGAYLEARMSWRAVWAPGDLRSFFEEMAKAFLTQDVRNEVRFTSALIIPITNLLITGTSPFREASHRYAMMSGNVAMLLITLYLGNPNKILVYTTTLPAYFPVHLLLISQLVHGSGFRSPWALHSTRALYGLYCVAMLLVYVLGTPLGWYH